MGPPLPQFRVVHNPPRTEAKKSNTSYILKGLSAINAIVHLVTIRTESIAPLSLYYYLICYATIPVLVLMFSALRACNFAFPFGSLILRSGSRFPFLRFLNIKWEDLQLCRTELSLPRTSLHEDYTLKREIAKTGTLPPNEKKRQ